MVQLLARPQPKVKAGGQQINMDVLDGLGSTCPTIYAVRANPWNSGTFTQVYPDNENFPSRLKAALKALEDYDRTVA